MAVGKQGAGFGHAGAVLGRAGTSTPSFVPDTAPSAYRTTTQSMVAGRGQNSANSYAPQLGSEFSISMWFRSVLAPEGALWNIFDQTASTSAESIAGGAKQALVLNSSGGLGGTLAFAGIDKAGNKFSASTVAIGTLGNGFGYTMPKSIVALGGVAILATLQVRNGNVELWLTYRGMAPELMVQRAVTWTGTDGPLPFWFGATNLGANSTGSLEMEMPIVFGDCALTQNQIAQLADGMHPETLASASAKASASIQFSTLTAGSTTADDRCDGRSPVDGDTITLNGATYTFRTSPSLGTELQTYADYIGNVSHDATTDTFTTATNHGLTDGMRVSIHRTTMPGGINARKRYYVINSTATTFQLSYTAGGTAFDVTTTQGLSSTTICVAATVLDALATQLNALTPNQGGASNMTYAGVGAETLVMTSRSAGGNAITFDATLATTTNIRYPASKRLSLAWVYKLDYTNYAQGFLGNVGVMRRRGTAWTVPVLGELAPNTQVTGSVRLTGWTEGMVTQHVGGTGKLSLSGVYTGNAPINGFQLKFYSQTDSSQVQDFTAVTSLVLDQAAKTFTAKLTVPKGKRWLLNEAKKTGDTQVTHRSEVKWGVGEVVIFMGRSHTCKFFNLSSTSAPVPNGWVSRFSGTGTVLGASSGDLPVDNTWHVFGSNDTTSTTSFASGAGEAAFGNKVSVDNDCVVGILTRAVGGVSFATLTTSTVFNQLRADALSSFTDESLGPIAGHYFWMHGQEDYTGLMDSLRTLVTTYFSSSCKLGLATCPNFGQSADYTIGDIHTPRNLQLQWLAANVATSNVVDLGDAVQYGNLSNDGVHSLDYTDIRWWGEIHANAILNKMSVAPYGSAGPTLASVSRSGAVLTLNWSLPTGSTALQIAHGNTTVGGVDVVLNSVGFTALRSSVSITTGTDRVNWAAHPLSANDPVQLTALTTQPGGATQGTVYYVLNPTANDFQISATPGGAVIDLTTAGAGVIATSPKNLLSIASHVLGPGAAQTTLTLSADPGAAVQVTHRWGRPGRQGTDPNNLDTTGRSVMSGLFTPMADNLLCDNFALVYANTNMPGRPARPTINAVVSS